MKLIDVQAIADKCREYLKQKRSIVLVEQLFLEKTKPIWETKPEESKKLLEWFWDYENRKTFIDKTFDK
jgi:hypothetical protein